MRSLLCDTCTVTCAHVGDLRVARLFRLSLLVLAHIFGLGEIAVLYYLKFIILATAQSFFLVKSLEYSMARQKQGSNEEMVTLLRYVLGGLQIPFIFFLMP